MTVPPIHYLFVYGSLRSGFQSPAYEYISRYFTLVGEGKVRGRLYDLGEYPAACPTDDDAWIVGELYHIKDERELDWALAQLDDYEGVKPDFEQEQHYYRDQAIVQLEHALTPAWIYWFRGDVTGKPVVPSGDMLQYLRDKTK